LEQSDWENPSFARRANCREEWAQELIEVYRLNEEIDEELGDFDSDV
jgi:hypothetical protein